MVINGQLKEMGKEMWEKEENEVKVSNVCRNGGRCWGMKIPKDIIFPKGLNLYICKMSWPDGRIKFM
jgi:hypothetical protein